jgi:hypothetical protein
MEVSGQLHAPAALPPRKDLVPIGYEAGCPQSRSRHGGEEKNSQYVCMYVCMYVCTYVRTHNYYSSYFVMLFIFL